MAKKIFTTESFAEFVNEIKNYVTNRVADKAPAATAVYFDDNDNETVILTADLQDLSELGELIGGDA